VFRSLRFRTWLLLMLATACALAAVGAVYIQSARATIRASLTDKAVIGARTGAGKLSAWLDARMEQARELSLNAAMRTGGTEERERFLAGELKRLYGQFADLGFMDEDGTLRMADGTVRQAPYDPSLQKALNGYASVSEPYFAEDDPRTANIGLYVPVYDRSYRIAGVLRASVPLDAAFKDAVDGTGAAEAGYLANEGGSVLYHTRGGTALDAQTREAVLRVVRGGLQGTEIGGSELLFAAPVGGTGWYWIAGISAKRLYKPLDDLLLRTVLACAAAELLLAGPLLGLIARPFRRIKAIQATTEAIADGRRAVRKLDEEPRDEIGALAASVNAMAEKLWELYEPLNAVRNQSEYGIVVTDRNYVVKNFNEAASRLLGYRPEEVIGRKTLVDFCDPAELEEKAKRLSAKLGATVAPGIAYFNANLQNRMSYSEERTYMHKNGFPVPVFLNVSKIIGRDGKVAGYIELFHDASRQKAIQAELTQAKQMAEEASNAKSIFLARMSHEIRTPLNGIVGLSKLLQRTKLTEIQRDYAQKIVSSSEVLLGIVDDILDFSKIEAGKVELETVAFEPDELFRKLADTLGIFLGKKQIELIFDIGPMPDRLIGDPLRLEQVLLNLLNNAIKFTNIGYVHFRVRTFRARGGEAELEFVVEDTGIGMSEEQIANLFQPFTQADGSTSRKYGGTGLGLVISDELVKLMGGRLEVESRQSVGSRFSFSLTFPVASSRKPEAPAAPVQATALCIERPGLMQRVLTELLASIGIEAVCADSWKKAIDMLDGMPEGQAFDYIFFNMEMGDMYGEETWFTLRRAARSAKTVAITTPFGQHEWLRMRPEERPDRMLIKPVNRRAVQTMLANLEEEARHNGGLPQAKRRKAELPERPRILLVEDHAINQQVAKELLDGRGYETGIASDGFEAMEKLADEDWDLVLMDLHMPGLDGFEATRAIRKACNSWQLPIVAMTANVLQEDRMKCFQAGMNGVVTKPFEPEELFAAVEEALRAAGRLDWEEANARVDGKQAILWHMLHTFRLENRTFAERLERSLAAGDEAGSLKMLHGLKGVAGNLSAVYLFKEAQAMEALLRREGLRPDNWRRPLERLDREIRELCEAIEFEENTKRFNLNMQDMGSLYFFVESSRNSELK